MDTDVTLKDGGDKVTITLERISTWAEAWQQSETLFMKNPMIGCLVIFIFLDIITGWLRACKEGKLSSRESYRGTMAKAQMGLIVVAAKFSEFIIPGGPWGNIVAALLCITELTSIVENAGKSGVPIPKSWLDAMAAFRVEQSKPLASVEVHTNIHSEKKDVDITTTQSVTTPPEGKKDKTPSDVVKTVVKMTDSQIMSHDELNIHEEK